MLTCDYQNPPTQTRVAAPLDFEPLWFPKSFTFFLEATPPSSEESSLKEEPNVTLRCRVTPDWPGEFKGGSFTGETTGKVCRFDNLQQRWEHVLLQRTDEMKGPLMRLDLHLSYWDVAMASYREVVGRLDIVASKK